MTMIAAEIRGLGGLDDQRMEQRYTQEPVSQAVEGL